jgi:hypothetical protein
VTIGQFLLKLACDEDLLRRFAGDGEAVMREAGLDDRQIQFLLNADVSEVRLKVEAELSVADERMAIVTIFTIPTIFGPPKPPSPPSPSQE